MKNKSRFIRTDVDRICEMQKAIDAYKIVISDILLLINGKHVNRIKSDIPQDIEIEMIYKQLCKRLEDEKD